MPQYRAETAVFDGEPTVVLADDRGQKVEIALHGAALLRCLVRRNGQPFDIAWGYRSGAEIRARSGSHFAILAPFAGRVADARYTFDGWWHDLEPGVQGPQRGFRHGFVRDADFEVVALEADDDAATVTLSTHAIRQRQGYPFPIDVSVRFTLDATGLTLDADLHNVGFETAPCFFGWHAYFRVGAGRADDWTLTIPAAVTIATDEAMIPVAGGTAYRPLDDAKELDFRQPRTIGSAILDHGYAKLTPAADGTLRSRLADPPTGFAIEVWQERGVIHAFTGDTLGAGARSAIALEPMECMADAFNRPEWRRAIALPAGAHRAFRCGVAWDMS